MINVRLMDKFVSKALHKLSGEWVIIGGSVLSLLGVDERVTMDIDIVPIDSSDKNSQTLVLLEVAQSLGLPVEVINQAGELFLAKISDDQDHLVIVAASKQCKIFRPDVYLFIKLKLARMTETDLSDCHVFMKQTKEEVKIFQNEIRKMILSHLKSAPRNKVLKLRQLLALINI